jgi:hypothetical protein
MITKRFNVDKDCSFIASFESIDSLRRFEKFTGLEGFSYEF